VQQISAGTLRVSSRIDNIALIPASPGPAFQAFCDQFCEALAAYGSVARVSSARVDAAFGVAGFAQTSDWDGNRIRFIDWLSGLERNHTYVVYEADDRLTPWTERCVRQADRGVVVGNASQSPEPSETETELIARLPADATQSKTLVLIQENGNPSGTQRWLALRNVDRHHHVRLGNRGDFARVVRFLTGRAVGLTLGGGFARGLAHIGVFRALADCNIPLDAVGGASMGGLIGALWASGWTNERIMEEISTGCRDSFNDMTLPFIAFKSGRKFSDLVARFFGEARIEDLWHPFFCVSANLNRAELTLHKSGGLTKATLASSRAPGIFPPIVYGGELHVDGGSINNVPVDLMRIFCGNGITIGVDVSPPHELEDVEDYGYTVSGLQALRSRFGLWGARKSFMPSIPLILMRTLEFGGISYRMTREGSADLMLQPEMLGFKRTDWHLADEIVAQSYRHAIEKIEGLNGTLGERIREIRTAQA
jgi:predicted acylesterase/phospholipase RssA